MLRQLISFSIRFRTVVLVLGCILKTNTCSQ